MLLTHQTPLRFLISHHNPIMKKRLDNNKTSNAYPLREEGTDILAVQVSQSEISNEKSVSKLAQQISGLAFSEMDKALPPKDTVIDVSEDCF